MFIEELTLPLDRLKGLGSETAKAFARLGVYSVGDLLLHYPRAYEDRSNFVPLEQAQRGEPVACIVHVKAHDFIDYRGEQVLKATVSDGYTDAVLVCYGRTFLQQTLAIGQKIYLYGVFQFKYNQLQTSSFDIEIYSPEAENFNKILPLYNLSGSLSQNKVRKMVKQAFELCPEHVGCLLPEETWQNLGLLSGKRQCLHQIHWPSSWAEYHNARSVLVMEELFLFHLALLWRRHQVQQKKRPAHILPMQYMHSAKIRLPFELTEDQNHVIEEIVLDLQQEYPMRRLLQGDVGTGKTLVALLCSCPLIEEGRQVAMMAPTELLARQHAQNAMKLFEPLGIRADFLTSNIRSTQRKQVLQNLANGDIQLVVGTHALFGADVEYADLGMVIIDEQHRFGVMQREKLLAKGKNPDLLLMTATPIPRTLALTVFGDLNCSMLRQYPAGRLPVRTHLVHAPNIVKVHQFVAGQLQSGHQVYYIYPLIEESEQEDLKNVQAMYEELKSKIFPEYKVGLIHSRVDEEEKRKTMVAFANGQIQVLAATTVVEVGVDVPNATVMVVEACERYGLATLHQLRGRIGRGEAQGYCFFVYNHLSEEGKARLKVLYETLDGFVIANEDLKLRGPGEFSGYRQSGAARFRLADLESDSDAFARMRTLAMQIFEKPEENLKIMQFLDKVQQRAGESMY